MDGFQLHLMTKNLRFKYCKVALTKLRQTNCTLSWNAKSSINIYFF